MAAWTINFVKMLLGTHPLPRHPYVRSILTVVDKSDPGQRKGQPSAPPSGSRIISLLKHDESIHNVPSDRPRAFAARAIGKPPSRGALKNGELLKTAEHDYDVTRALLEHGVLLPEHVPIVCPSFAASDLAMLKDKSGYPVKFSEADDGTRVRDDEPEKST